MFDSLGWSWEYEPYDLDGYIPDFALIFRTGISIVEIKPDLQFKTLTRYQPKIDRSGWDDKILLLGGTPFLDGIRDGKPQKFGWCRQKDWGTAVLFKCNKCKKMSMSSTVAGHQCYVSGCLGYTASAITRLEAMWGKAHNLTKWTG